MKRDSPLFVVGFVIALSVVFGTGVAAMHYATLGMLARNEALLYNRTVAAAFQLQPSGSTAELQKAIDRVIVRDTLVNSRGRRISVLVNSGTDETGFVFSGIGFWDRIEGILVLNAALDTIRNLQILEQHETPGLGARITEPWFTDQFKGLPVDWDASPAEHIFVGASSTPGATNRVDGVTGASQTSMALMRMLNEELVSFRDAWQAKKTGGNNG